MKVRYCSFDKTRQRYVFQMRVPMLLQLHFGTAMLKEHLGNSEERAASRAQDLAARYRYEFERLRQQKTGLPEITHSNCQTLNNTPEIAARIASTYFFEASRQLLSSILCLDNDNWGELALELQARLKHAKSTRRSQSADNYDQVKAVLEQKFSVHFRESILERKTAIATFNQAQVEWFDNALSYLNGELAPEALYPSRTTLLPLFELWGHPANALLNTWVAQTERGNRAVNSKTLEKLSLIVRDVEAVLGRRCVESMTHDDILAIAERWTKAENSHKTMDTKLGCLVALLRPFLSEDTIKTMTRGILPAKPKVNQAYRLPFSKAQLEKLIPELQSKGQVEFHLFMLMLLTGARREEISQLQACHLQEEDGFLIISIADARQSGMVDMEIKNHASTRSLPVDTKVIPGLSERVSECLENNGQLFPELFEDQHGDLSNRESKRINRLIDKVVGKDRRYVLQSTRPTTAVALRRAGMDTRLRRRFLGHTDGDIHEAHYEPGEILTCEDFIPLAIALRDFVKPFFPVIPDKLKVIAIHDAPSSLGNNDGEIYRYF